MITNICFDSFMLFFFKDCEVISPEEIHCPSPPLFPQEPHRTSSIIHSRRHRRGAFLSSKIQQEPHQLHLFEHGISDISDLPNLRVVRSPITDFSKNGKQEHDSGMSLIRIKRVEPIKVAQLGFIMDGVLSVRNLTDVVGLDSRLKYYPNPRIFNFSEPSGVKVFKGEMLIIEVNLSLQLLLQWYKHLSILLKCRNISIKY